MLEETIREIEELEYPHDEILRGLREEGIKDRGGAAAFGFGEAQERIVEIIRSHNNEGWIYCGDGKNLPTEPFGCIVTVIDTEPMTMTDFENILPYHVGYDGEQWNDENGEEIPFEVIAWKKCPSPFRPQKSVGEDYKQQIMERFLKVE